MLSDSGFLRLLPNLIVPSIFYTGLSIARPKVEQSAQATMAMTIGIITHARLLLERSQWEISGLFWLDRLIFHHALLAINL